MTQEITVRKAQTPEKQAFSLSLLQRYFNFLQVSKTTEIGYKKNLQSLWQYMQDNNIQLPTRQDLISFRQYLIETCKPSTVQTYLSSVRLFFRWTASEGLYPNIADNLKGIKVSRAPKKDNLTSQQVKYLLDCTKNNPRNHALLALLITTGLRTIEVSRANFEDLQTRGNSTVLYIQGKGKTEKNDFVKIPQQVEKLLRAYLSDRNAKDGEPLFTSDSNHNNNGRLATGSISRLIKTIFRQAGFNSDRLTAHSTRHTAVTLALLGNEKLEDVQMFARHANIQTTLIYAHNLEKERTHCENTIANSIFN